MERPQRQRPAFLETLLLLAAGAAVVGTSVAGTKRTLLATTSPQIAHHGPAEVLEGKLGEVIAPPVAILRQRRLVREANAETGTEDDVPASSPPPPAGPRRVERVEERVAGGSGEVTETQHAVCEVSTEELAAKATATVTRVLKGLCNAKEMEQRFGALERQLANQLDAVRVTLLGIEDRLQEQESTARRAHARLLAAALKCASASGGGGGGGCGAAGVSNGRRWSTGDVSPVDGTVATEDEAQTDDAAVTGTGGWTDVPPRNDEIERYNSSIHMLPGGRRVFTYYWRVPHITHKLSRWDPDRSLRSPSFYTSQGGYRMYLRLYPRRGGENAYVHAGLTPGAFDEDLSWPFALKLRVSVLEQSAGASEDVTSRVWDATELCSGFNWQRPLAGDSHECVGLGLPHSLLRQRSYVWRDSVLVKLTVFLANGV